MLQAEVPNLNGGDAGMGDIGVAHPVRPAQNPGMPFGVPRPVTSSQPGPVCCVGDPE
jgi:hypothetical protein